MAEGRMLKRNISISKRLPQLKTDSARMLWAWIIPYLDVEGRYYASPDLIKANVVPRLKTFTEANITQYLQDMADVGLIIIYEIDNELYLQYRNFDKFQSLRKDREGKPLPAPPPNYRTTPGPLPEQDRTTPAEVKLSKDKLREANAREEENNLPVDSSEKDSPLETEKSELKESVNQIFIKYPKFPVHTFLGNHNRDHPGAILHCLKSLLKAESIDNPLAYCEAAMTIENGKYNARDEEAKHQDRKRPTGKEMERLGEIMHRAMAAQPP